MKNKPLFLYLVIVLFTFIPASFARTLDRKVEENKKNVLDFYDLAFNRHKPSDAAKKYMAANYIEHNPHALNGADAFAKYFEVYLKDNPQFKTIIHRVIAENDLVVLHANSKKNDKDLGMAVIDIFRLRNGKIVEHFDVIQNVPNISVNGNTMFDGNK